jgi:hypothetical protein
MSNAWNPEWGEDEDVPEYPYEHITEMQRKWNRCGLHIYWGTEFCRTPFIPEVKLFPDLHDKIREDLPNLWKFGKGKGTQIRNLAKKYKLIDKTTKDDDPKAYKKALKTVQDALKTARQMLRHQLLYEEYKLFPEYFDWLHTPEHFAYCRRFIEKVDAAYKRRCDEFETKVAAGTEHVVGIEWLDKSLNEILDNPIGAYEAGQEPMSHLVKRMTRHDFDILMERGLIEIRLGDPETIGNYEFAAKRETERPVLRTLPKVEKCVECGAILDHDTIGVSIKLGAGEGHYRCYACNNITEAEAKKLIEFYKSTGCTIFG